jgi:hypothetical protein
MQRSSENIGVFFIVTETEAAHALTELLSRIGLKTTVSESFDDLLQSINDNPTIIWPLLADTMNHTILSDILCGARSLSPSPSCIVFISQNLSKLESGLARFAWQPLGKQSNHKTLSEIEKEHIINTLENNGWQYKATAKMLGIDRSTLYRKLKKYGIHKGER